MHQAEIETLMEFRRLARVLGKSRDPRQRIAASQWEIFFEEKLAEAKASAPQPELAEAR